MGSNPILGKDVFKIILYMSIYLSNIFINYIELKYRIIYFIISFLFVFIILFYYKIELFFYISEFFLLRKQEFIYNNL